MDEYKDDALDLTYHLGNIQVIEILADSGIDIDRRDREEDFMPLTTAAFFDFRKCTEVMLKHAASTEVYIWNPTLPLRYATSKNEVELRRILLENPANLNTTDGGEPLLRECVSEAFFEIVKLVENGAKVDTGSSKE